jgi:hypothetical protein
MRMVASAFCVACSVNLRLQLQLIRQVTVESGAAGLVMGKTKPAWQSRIYLPLQPLTAAKER